MLLTAAGGPDTVISDVELKRIFFAALEKLGLEWAR